MTIFDKFECRLQRVMMEQNLKFYQKLFLFK